MKLALRVIKCLDDVRKIKKLKNGNRDILLQNEPQNLPLRLTFLALLASKTCRFWLKNELLPLKNIAF